MLEKLLRLYAMSMAWNVRSPMPHVVGPPGCGKSTYFEQLAELLDVDLHIINVSRLSPLELEGVMMPHGNGDDMILKMLPSTFWTSLKDGDILLLDEFLRGFPEVYNGMLDIFTSRRVGAFHLPKVFIVGASNSVIAYDQALEDRLLHIPVPDPRKSAAEKKKLGAILCNEVGLLPQMATSYEMSSLLDAEVLPMFDLLDTFKASSRGTTVKKGGPGTKGHSLRNLIGQAQMRWVTTPALKDLINTNNHAAITAKKWQYVVVLDPWASAQLTLYRIQAAKLIGNDRLTRVQALNLSLNLQLLEMEDARTTSPEEDEEDDGYIPVFD